MRQSNPKREVRYQKAVFFCKKENSALSEHTCLINHTVEWDNSKTRPCEQGNWDTWMVLDPWNQV